MPQDIDRNRIREEVIHLLRNNGKTAFRPKEIAKKLSYDDNRVYRAFRDVLAEMAERGEVHEGKGRRYFYKKKGETLEGVVRVHPEGYGFVSLPDEEKDVYVSHSRMGTALDKDRVEVTLLAPSRGDRRQEGEIVKVVERGHRHTVGTFRRSPSFGFVESDDQRINHDIYVAGDERHGAQEGDKVLVSIDRWDDPKASPEGRILQVIGKKGDPGIAVKALAMSQDVRFDFPPEVERAAEKIKEEIPESEIRRRLDLRGKRVFTIDPFDAKDFDDAIHIEELESGNFEVGVHIADVSHYVETDTPLDAEAFKRATSVYLVDRVNPMLPEKLSNKVCSLRPNETKLTYSCILEVTPGGKVERYDIRETVIESQHRLTYEEAQIIIEGGNDGHPYAADIRRAHELASTMRKQRFQAGSIDFATAESKVILDDEGNPVEIIKKVQREANHLIEEFMLLANRTVSKHVGGGGKNARPFVYRVHDRPDSEKISNLADYVRAFGYEMKLTGDSVDSKELNRLIQAVKGSPEEPIIQEAALRSMAKAKYAIQNIGHYGLGFKHYSHFTSPIRRYPDLIVHRLLKRYASGGGEVNPARLAEQADHCSERERAAEEAERESVKLKKVEYMTQHVGDKFKGVVSGVTKFGVFVELTELLVEGLVHVRDMDDDYYEYDEKKYMLIGQHSNRRIRLGDPITVKVLSADVENRRIDFVFA